jgi:hypothetical protein
MERGPREKKLLFIRYSEIAKGYVFIGEEMSGSVKEIESRDATFNEDEFPSKSEVYRNLQLYETSSDDVLGPHVEEGRILSSSTSTIGQVQLKLNQCSKLLKSINLVRKSMRPRRRF